MAGVTRTAEAGRPRPHRWRRRLLVASGVLLVLAAIGLYAASVLIVRSVFTHRVDKHRTTPAAMGMPSETIAVSSADGIALKAWWVPSQRSASRGIIIVLHGMDGLDASSMLGHARFLREAGYDAIALDMRAHGRSAGTRIGLAFEEPADVAAVLDWIKAQPRLAHLPVALVGISMGGATAIRTAAARPDVKAVISAGSFASVDRMLAQFMRGMNIPAVAVTAWEPCMRLALLTEYHVWPSRASPLADISRMNGRPILIVHGGSDDQIPVAHAGLLAGASNGRTSVWIVKGAGHIVFEGDATGPESAEYRTRVLAFLEQALVPSAAHESIVNR